MAAAFARVERLLALVVQVTGVRHQKSNPSCHRELERSRRVQHILQPRP